MLQPRQILEEKVVELSNSGAWHWKTSPVDPPFPQLHPGQLGPLENRREDQGFLQESHRQQTQGSPESQGQQPLPASTPPTHAGNNQKGWLSLSWLTVPAPGTGERQGVLLKGGQQP